MKQAKYRTKGQELWKIVEADIGHAHISDAIDDLPDDRVFNLARGSLKSLERAARKIRNFLKKYGEPTS